MSEENQFDPDTFPSYERRAAAGEFVGKTAEEIRQILVTEEIEEQEAVDLQKINDDINALDD